VPRNLPRGYLVQGSRYYLHCRRLPTFHFELLLFPYLFFLLRVRLILPFTSRTKAARLVSSLRIGAVALRQERESVTIDSPQAVADLCVEMRFFDRGVLRVVLLNAKQKLIDVATVSQGSVNESLARPREVFKPAIVISAYSFIMVHNL
jgi:RadC-like JAB domain